MLMSFCKMLFWIALHFAIVAEASLLYGEEYQAYVKEYTGKKHMFMESEDESRIVEFYSPTCPACRAFKPEYIKLAKTTIEKYPQVSFYAVSCDDFWDVCKNYGVEGFPSLFYFKAGSKKGTEMTDHNSKYTAEHISEKLDLPAYDLATTQRNMEKKPEFNESPVNIEVKKSEDNTDSGRKEKKFSSGSIKKEKQKEKKLNRFQEEIKKEKDDYNKKRKGLGKLMHKDHRKDKNGKEKKRANPDEMTTTMELNKPGTEAFKKRQQNMLHVLEVAKNRKKRMSAPPKTEGNPAGKITLENFPYQKDVRKPKIALMKRWTKLTNEEALILDVSNAFYMSLETSLFLKNDRLTSTQTRAFKEYLELLSISLPLEWRLHKAITDLRRSYVRVSDSRNNLLAVLENHPIEFGWSKECLKAGFSCGFWKLLHTVTVGVAEQRGGLNLIDSQMISPGAKTFSPSEAADVIRNYIDNFFSCNPCRDNFINMYDNCDNNRRCDRLTDEKENAGIAGWKELATWLWEVHNEVSVRIVNERARKQQESLPANSQVSVSAREQVKALWPNLDDCIMCFNEDGSWHEAEVFKYLEKTYWHGSDLDPKSDRLLKFENEIPSENSFVLLVCAYFIFYVVYHLVSSNSNLIRRSVIRAKHMAILSNFSGKKLRKI